MANETKKTEENKEEEFKIPVEELFSDFEKHLGEENNSRILFSGKFGIGKTYFLNEFFKNEEYENKYEVFHLYPINYQISSNEDIIELLKYDILVELFNRNEDSFFEQDESVKLKKSLITWSKNNSLDIVKNAISYIPKIGKPLNETIGLLTRLAKFHEESKNKDLKIIENFLQDSNIVETDFLSEILRNKITEQKSDKESVLILDDLDRIDPEHIFRILNVFSAQLNLDNEELPNKFGFNKVVLVGDYSNLKSIFHHKYGTDTDESGYFDKFYSSEVFQFKNEELIESFISNIISKIKIEDVNNIKKSMEVDRGFLAIMLKNVLIKSLKLSNKNRLNLRQLLKGVNIQLVAFKVGQYNPTPWQSREQNIKQFIKIGTMALVSIFGDFNNFLNILEEIKLNLTYSKSNDNIYNNFSFNLLNLIYYYDNPDDFEGFKVGEITWKNKYNIKFTENRISELNHVVDQEDISLEMLFFELLSEYVRKDYYLKTIEIW